MGGKVGEGMQGRGVQDEGSQDGDGGKKAC